MNIRRVAVTPGGGDDYEITIAAKASEQDLAPFVKDGTCLIVSDSNVAGLHLGSLREAVINAGAKSVFTMQFDAGEQSKNIENIMNICRFAASRKLDRKSVMIALGGGVTGDMTGFASAIYMRGIGFLQVPTSLLAMVDSSVGGKTGVDIPEGKNLIGAFHQPLAVKTSLEYLDTLPSAEYTCGMAEIIKTAAILDEEFFADMEKNISLILKRDQEYTGFMVARSCELKARIVKADEKENGVRAVLNYGHTFGHAVESSSGFTIPHGRAVAVGMSMMCSFAVKAGLMDEKDSVRQKKLLAAAGLPLTAGFDPEKVFAAMLGDKKASGGGLRFVVTPRTGKAEIITPSADDVRSFLSGASE